MASVDTNVLLRLVLDDDAAQVRRAESFLKREGPLWISNVVLVETCWVLLTGYKWPKSDVISALRSLQDSADFIFQASQAVRSAIDFYETTKADFADCLALEVARAEGQLPLGTFDRAASKLPGTTVLY